MRWQNVKADVFLHHGLNSVTKCVKIIDVLGIC